MILFLQARIFPQLRSFPNNYALVLQVFRSRLLKLLYVKEGELGQRVSKNETEWHCFSFKMNKPGESALMSPPKTMACPECLALSNIIFSSDLQCHKIVAWRKAFWWLKNVQGHIHSRQRADRTWKIWHDITHQQLAIYTIVRGQMQISSWCISDVWLAVSLYFVEAVWTDLCNIETIKCICNITIMK